jgi:hypothetical protein
MHAWRLVSKDLLDVDSQTHQFLDLLDAYSEHRKEVYEEVSRRSQTKIEDSVIPLEEKAQEIEQSSPDVKPVEDHSKQLPEIPRDLEIRLQKFVGLAILPDIQSEQLKKPLSDHEPAFQVLCVAETEDEIEKYFRQWSERYLSDDTKFGLFSSVPLACLSM